MTEQLGWLDTNIFLHSLYHNDPEFQRSRAILAALDSGEAEAWLDPVVVHELTYALARHPSFSTRQAIHAYVRDIVLTDTIHLPDKDGMIEALARWESQGSGFADAWLAVLACRHGLPVCSANRRHFPDVQNSF
ncbi:MAG: PIN domain-containing protein [Chloroflexi bacterium]|nr:PIN domain-containing protein [Chloroflexota bacterium]